MRTHIIYVLAHARKCYRLAPVTEEDPVVDAWRGLLVAHSRLVPAVEADLRAAGQVPLSWYDVLLELNAAPGRRLRMSELGQRTVLSRTRVSRVVDELAAAGLAERQPDQADGRSSFAVLTSEGNEALRRAWPVYRQAIHRQLAGADHPGVPRAGRAARPGDRGGRPRPAGHHQPVAVSPLRRPA